MFESMNEEWIQKSDLESNEGKVKTRRILAEKDYIKNQCLVVN